MNKYHKVLLSGFLVLIFVSGVILVSKNQNFLLPVFSQDPTTYDPTVWDGVGTSESTEPVPTEPEPTSTCTATCPNECTDSDGDGLDDSDPDNYECVSIECDTCSSTSDSTSTFAAAAPADTPVKINGTVKRLRMRSPSPIGTASPTTTTSPSPSPTSCGGSAPTCNGLCPMTADGMNQSCVIKLPLTNPPQCKCKLNIDCFGQECDPQCEICNMIAMICELKSTSSCSTHQACPASHPNCRDKGVGCKCYCADGTCVDMLHCCDPAGSDPFGECSECCDNQFDHCPAPTDPRKIKCCTTNNACGSKFRGGQCQ